MVCIGFSYICVLEKNQSMSHLDLSHIINASLSGFKVALLLPGISFEEDYKKKKNSKNPGDTMKANGSCNFMGL